MLENMKHFCPINKSGRNIVLYKSTWNNNKKMLRNTKNRKSRTIYITRMNECWNVEDYVTWSSLYNSISQPNALFSDNINSFTWQQIKSFMWIRLTYVQKRFFHFLSLFPVLLFPFYKIMMLNVLIKFYCFFIIFFLMCIF